VDVLVQGVGGGGRSFGSIHRIALFASERAGDTAGATRQMVCGGTGRRAGGLDQATRDNSAPAAGLGILGVVGAKPSKTARELARRVGASAHPRRIVNLVALSRTRAE